MDLLLVAKILVFILAFAGIGTTVLSILDFTYWWVRIFDFPRLQSAVLCLAALTGILAVYGFNGGPHLLLGLVLLLCFVYQISRISPYTRLWRKQVQPYKGHDQQNNISLMVSNVLTPNRRYDLLLKQVNKFQPTFLLTLETDDWWEEKLSPLENDYPYTVRVPLSNYYGMHLYSRYELVDPQVRFLVEDDIPSISTLVKMPTGELIRLYCLHPAPPVPERNESSVYRDAELLIVGREAKDCQCPVIVMGDLNDVAWSDTTLLFRRISGLLDPRIGRGLYNTFHAGYRLLRWPLDHIFHSAHFTLIRLKRLPNIGSDHFPIYASVHLGKKVLASEEESPTEDELEMAEEKIAEASSSFGNSPTSGQEDLSAGIQVR